VKTGHKSPHSAHLWKNRGLGIPMVLGRVKIAESSRGVGRLSFSTGLVKGCAKEDAMKLLLATPIFFGGGS